MLSTEQNGGRPAASYATLGMLPGQPMVFDLYAVNDSSHPVRVTGVRLLPLEGYALPHLDGDGVVSGNITAGLNRGWPPPDAHISRLVGAELRPGRTDLAIAASGTKVGTDYGTLGAELTYHDGGRVYRARVYGGAVACVRAVIGPCPPRVQADDRRVTDLIHAQ